MQPHERIEAYVKEVGRHIYWKKAQKEVEDELRDHIQSLVSSYTQQGLDGDAAADAAVKELGDARELGRELNRANRPAPEWAKGNVFMKGTLRQPVRSLLLILLIALASFMFIMRTTEFMVVSDSIHEAAAFYRSIGFLAPMDDVNYVNVLEAADMLAQSPFIGFADRRRGVEGILTDMMNSDIDGMNAWQVGTIRGERLHFAYFYATIGGRTRELDLWDGTPGLRLNVNVDEVIIGFPEHVLEGQRLSLDFRLPEGRYDLHGVRDIILEMTPGERFLFKGAFHRFSAGGYLPREDNPISPIVMHPLNRDDIWFVPVPEGRVDFSLPGLENLYNDIAQSVYNHSVVYLRTSKDMTADHRAQADLNQIRLRQGRFIDREDYEQARPVAVIHFGLAAGRGIAIGDTIRVSIPSAQRIVFDNTINFIIGWTRTGTDSETEPFTFRAGDTFVEHMIFGDASYGFIIEELELEVVGTHDILPRHSTPRRNLNARTGFDNYIFIPDSLLPAGFNAAHDEYDVYLWDYQFSFLLADTRDESAFMLAYRGRMADMGLSVMLLPAGAEGFWQSAQPMLRTAAFNVIVFLAVLLLVVVLVAYLYLLSKRKDFAILRALGQSSKKAAAKLCSALVLLGLPAVLLGGVSGWYIALDRASQTVNPLIEAGYYQVYMTLPAYMLALQLTAVFVLLLAMAFAGAMLTARRPVFELIQGRAAAKVRR